MSWKKYSPTSMTSGVAASSSITPPSSARKQEEGFTVDHLSDKVQAMKEGLTTAESSLKCYSMKKKELERLLEKSTQEVQQLQDNIAKMKGERAERKLREEMLIQDIKRLTEEIELVKKEEKDLLANDKEEEANVDATVAEFEKNSLYRARLLRLRIPGGKDESMKNQIENVQKDINDMENEIKRITLENESRSLPFEEMKVLLMLVSGGNFTSNVC